MKEPKRAISTSPGLCCETHFEEMRRLFPTPEAMKEAVHEMFERERRNGRFGVVNGRLSVFQARSDPPSFAILHNFPKLPQILSDLGIPLNPQKIYYSWFLGGGDYTESKGAGYKKAQLYTVECFGELLDEGGEKDIQFSSEYGQPVFWDETIRSCVLWWRTRVYSKSPAELGICASQPMSTYCPEFPYIESKWDPTKQRETLRMGGFEMYIGCLPMLNDFCQRAANILMKRPIRFGRTKFDRAQFRKRAIAIHDRLWLETGQKPGQYQVALEMGLNEYTFKSRWAQTGGNWDSLPKPKLKRRRKSRAETEPL